MRIRELLFCAVLAGCGRPESGVSARKGAAMPPASSSGLFTDVADAAGIGFRHRLPQPDLRNIVEGVGGGGAFADFDGDGWPDLIVLGGPRSPAGAAHGGVRVYRNLRDGRFEDVTARSGIPRDSTAVAAAAGDYDGDGKPDLYLADRGRSRLYHNLGGMRFADVTREAGVADEGRFAVGAVFFDADGDGRPDLYVANYLEFDPAEKSYYAPDAYPGPAMYKAEPGALYRNRGDGTFEDVSARSGVAALRGRAMQAAAFDADGDGRTDLFIANDVTENFLLINDGKGGFQESAELAGVAFGEQGERTSAMSASVGDIDGDGQPDIAVSDTAYGTLYRRVRPGFFRDEARRYGMPEILGQHPSWGMSLADFDNDGALDLVAVQADLHYLNGWEPLFLRNSGRGRFEDASSAGGAFFARHVVGRGVIAGDYDNDGDIDLLVTTLAGPPVLLRNDSPPRNSWLTLDLGWNAFGSTVELEAGGRKFSAEYRVPSTYLGQDDPRLHFGFGPGVETVSRLRVVWPDKKVLTLTGVKARQILRLKR